MIYSNNEIKRIRKNFSKIPKILNIPYLLSIQTISYNNFLYNSKDKNSGLDLSFKSIFPICNYNHNIKLSYLGYKFKNLFFNDKECQLRGLTYSIGLKVKLNLSYYIINKNKKKKKIKNIFIVKPGIININIKKKIVEKLINKYSKIKNFGIKDKIKHNIVIDYSSPNICKEMHIGHLRSTVLGDSISNIAIFLGHNIIRINHIGDWGINISTTISWIIEKNININKYSIKKIEKIYKKSQKLFNKNKKFQKKVKKNLIKLQKNNNKKIINIWKKITNLTIIENQKIYNKLNIKLNNKNIYAESFYKNKLNKIIKDLLKKKIAKIDKNTILVKNKNNNNTIIIKKKDGCYLYSTIDIACIKYRIKKFKANKILYFTDNRQKEYMKNIFYIVKKAKYISKKNKLIHFYFGNILNKLGKPYKTRKGNNIKLKKIIKKSILYNKKKNIIKYKNKYNNNQINLISKKIAISAIKYMDLSKNRLKNYIFNYEKIFSLKNNTGPYILYSYIRIISILKKNNTNISKSINNNVFLILNKLEYKISKNILLFKEIIKKSYKKGTTHYICNYIYNISILFSKFYEIENITNIQNIKHKKSKLKLIAIIGKIIKICLMLLGISTLKKM